MKKIIGVIACGLFLNAAAASSQVTDKEKVQMEKRIEKLIKKMTLEEKVGLLHGNSKFYVAGVERLGIPEWSLSDGPHGVRAEINRHDWAYAGWTNDSASYFHGFRRRLESGVGLPSGRGAGRGGSLA